MTTNQSRAAEVIIANSTCDFCEVLVDPGETCSYCKRLADCVSQTLAEAGLLMPDLPADIPTSRDHWPDIFTEGGKVYGILNSGYDSDWQELSPEESQDFGLRLIAASKQAEQEQSNE